MSLLMKGKQKTSNPPPPPPNNHTKPPKPSISTIQTHNSNSNRYSAVATPQSVEIVFQTSPGGFQQESPTRARSPFRFDGYSPLPLVELKSNTESSPRPSSSLLLQEDSTTTTDLRSEIYGGSSGGDDSSDAKSSVMMAVFNFTNSIIGAGIMGLPYAMNKAGFGMGILLLFLLTFIVGPNQTTNQQQQFFIPPPFTLIERILQSIQNILDRFRLLLQDNESSQGNGTN
jgi:hypothetical protein